MNVVKVMGGLGNQLFQYAFGQAMVNNGTEVTYDLSWFNAMQGCTPRNYHLDKFTISVPAGGFLNQQAIHETIFESDMLNVTNCNFFGYWQYPLYHSSITSRLQDTLKVNKVHHTAKYLWLKLAVTNQEFIALHVRRGDYLTTRGFRVLPLNYYLEAIQHFPQMPILVFSDDIPWCEQHIKSAYFGREIVFVHLQEEYLAWDIMRQCKHYVIANSSFSLFAACMCTNENKIVVYPETWQKDDVINRGEYFDKKWIAV